MDAEGKSPGWRPYGREFPDWQPYGGEFPDWWPYGGEFPDWAVWRGVDRLYYARLRDAGPPQTVPGERPLTVRGEDPVDLRDQIRAALLRPGH